MLQISYSKKVRKNEMSWPTHIIAVGGLVYNEKGEVLVAKSVRKNT